MVSIEGEETCLQLISTNEPLSNEDITRYERTLKYSLPTDYRDFLLNYNGGRTGNANLINREESNLKKHKLSIIGSVLKIYSLDGIKKKKHKLVRSALTIAKGYEYMYYVMYYTGRKKGQVWMYMDRNEGEEIDPPYLECVALSFTEFANSIVVDSPLEEETTEDIAKLNKELESQEISKKFTALVKKLKMQSLDKWIRITFQQDINGTEKGNTDDAALVLFYCMELEKGKKYRYAFDFGEWLELLFEDSILERITFISTILGRLAREKKNLITAKDGDYTGELLLTDEGRKYVKNILQ